MTNLRLELLSELEQTPEQYIPELLNLVRLFRQNQINIAIGSSSSKTILNNILEEMEDAEDIADAKIALQEDGFIPLADVKKELGIN
jgi:beta-phosphoglucomutase-like phosphatase (HAD superfamily)